MLRQVKEKVGVRRLAIISLIIVGACYSILGLNSRLLSKGLEPMTQVYLRIMLGFLVSLILFRKQIDFKKIKNINTKDWMWLIIMGVIGYSIAVYYITLAVLNTKLVNVGIIYATLPFIVYIISFFLLKEKFNAKLMLLVLIAIYGVSIVASKSLFPQLNTYGKGELFALLSAICASQWSIGRKKLSSFLTNSEITAITMLIAAVSGALIAAFIGETFTIDALFMRDVLIGLGIGAFLNATLSLSENFAFSHIDVVFGNQLLMLESIFSLSLGYFIYKEVITVTEVIGCVLILGSVCLSGKLLANTE